ncbi:MAG: hypothetical protein O9320_20635, partial [Magnetospirillum sp.]|nr:hypothetical protein [Magnetospirillum sp.]
MSKLSSLNPFGRFSLVGQVYAAFGLLGLLLAAASAYGVVGFKRTTAESTGAAEIGNIYDFSQRVELRMTQTRNAINIWLQAPTQAQADAVGATFGRLDAAVKDLENARINDAERSNVAAYKATLGKYRDESWATIQGHFAARATLADELDRVGPTVLTNLQRLRDEAAASGQSTTATALDLAAENYMRGRLPAMRYRTSQADADMESAARTLNEAIAAATEARRGAPAAFAARIDASIAALTAYRNENLKIQQTIKDLEAVRAVFRAQGNSLSALTDELRKSLEARAEAAVAAAESAVKLREWTISIGGALALALALVIAVAFVASLKRPLAILVDVATQLANGRDDVAVAASARKDELGALLNAMRALCETVGQSFRLRQMVEEMPTPVMTADPKNVFRIGYANRAAVETLRGVAEHLPCAPEALVGTELGKLHRDGLLQPAALADAASLPRRTTLHIGKEIFDVRVSAIRDKAGAYVGPMLVWNVVTRQTMLADDFEKNVKSVVDQVASSAVQMTKSSAAMGVSADDTMRQSTIVASASEQAS